MNCRTATVLLRSRPTASTPAQTIDDAAEHIAGCLLCQEELLGLVEERPGLTAQDERNARALREVVSECQAVQPRMAAYVNAVRTGASAAARFPDVFAHLQSCPSCALDYQQLTALALPWLEQSRTVTLAGGLRAAVRAVGARFRDVPAPLLPHVAYADLKMGERTPKGEVLTVRPPGADFDIVIRLDPGRDDRLHLDVTIRTEGAPAQAARLALFVVDDDGREPRADVPGHSLSLDVAVGTYEIEASLEGRSVDRVVIPFAYTPKEPA